MSALDQVITVAEAVELSGLNVRMVQRYCKSGKFEARQDLKGNWLILKSSIQPKEEIKMIKSELDIDKQKEYITHDIINGESLEAIVKWIVAYANREDAVDLLLYTFSAYNLLGALPESST